MTGLVTDTRSACNGNESSILSAMGLQNDVKRGRNGRGEHGPCPICGGKDRFRFDFTRGRWHCTQCVGGDIIDLVREYEGLEDTTAAALRVRQMLGLPVRANGHQSEADKKAQAARLAELRMAGEERERERRADAEREAAAQLRKARGMWQRRVPLADSPAARYWKARGLTFEPGPNIEYLEGIGDLPHAMISAFVDLDCEGVPVLDGVQSIRGVALTRLSPDGAAKAGGEADKVIIGQGNSLPIVISVGTTDNETLLIAEGVEDAASAAGCTNFAAWAAGVANRLPGLADHIPSWVRRVIIVEDDDADIIGKSGEARPGAGPANVRKLAELLTARGIDVLIERGGEKISTRKGMKRRDLNDELRQNGPEAVSDRLARAIPFTTNRDGDATEFAMGANAIDEITMTEKAQPFPKGNQKATPAQVEDIYVDTPQRADTKYAKMAEDTVVWPTPESATSLCDIPAPRFPTDRLPIALQAWANDTAARIQCPVEMVAVPMLAAVAGAVGKDAGIHLGGEWVEQCALYAMTIAPPSLAKTPTFKAATFPLRKVENEWRPAWERRVAEWRRANDEYKIRHSAWKKECRKLAEGDPNSPLPIAPAMPGPMPQEPRSTCTDTTIEKLAIMMQESRGLTVLRDELSGLLLNLNRYANGGSDRQFYLEAYSGGSYKVDRVSRESVNIGQTYLSIIGGIQPAVAQRVFSAQYEFDDGLLERFACMAYPGSVGEWKDVDDKVDMDAREAYEDCIRTLMNADWHKLLQSDSEINRAAICRFDERAAEVWKVWLRNHQRALRAMVDGDQMFGFAGKAQGFLARICLVLHLAKWASGEIEDSMASWIMEETVREAIHLVDDFFFPTWRRVVGAFSRSIEESKAARVARIILERPDFFREKGVRIRDIVARKIAGLRKADEVLPALDALIDAGWLREMSSSGELRRGRPSIWYKVNPAVWAG